MWQARVQNRGKEFFASLSSDSHHSYELVLRLPRSIKPVAVTYESQERTLKHFCGVRATVPKNFSSLMAGDRGIPHCEPPRRRGLASRLRLPNKPILLEDRINRQRKGWQATTGWTRLGPHLCKTQMSFPGLARPLIAAIH